jgi:transketolase C-terminal domain/subunit
MMTGSDITLIGYGTQIQVLKQVQLLAKEELDVNCEIIDLRTILPWDVTTVVNVRIIIDNIGISSFFSQFVKLVELWYLTKLL